MSEDNKLPGEGNSSSFVEPFRHALNRMQSREILSRDQYVERAEQLLVDRFGSTGSGIERGFSYGMVGVQANHTHYYNGFALMKPMHMGTAVACRASLSPGVRIVFEGDPQKITLNLNKPGRSQASLSESVVAAVLTQLGKPKQGGVEMAVVTSIPQSLESSYLSSMAVAVWRSLEAMYSISSDDKERIRRVTACLEEVINAKFSSAFVIGATVEHTDEFVLMDAETLGHISVPSPGRDRPEWALIRTSEPVSQRDRTGRTQIYEEIVSRLKQKRFPELRSLRDLEHRHLELASAELPRRLRPALRFLVSENRRVQRMVAAIRHQDWQMMGALLLMSHASRKNDWIGTSAIQDFVVESAERFSLEGVYGAAWTGEGSFVLVLGQPFRLPAFLDHLRSSWPDPSAGEPDLLVF